MSGYSLEHLLPERGRDLSRFLVGTEGTLGVVAGATVRLVVDEPFRALAVLGYPSMFEAADAVPALLHHPLVACEGLDSRIVDVVRTGTGSVPDLPRGAGWLFAEVTGSSAEEAHAAASAVAADAGAVDVRLVGDAREMAALWRIREDGAGLAARSLDRPAHSGWEDAAVPPERLGDYLRGFDALLRESGLDGVPYGHFGDGCVHVRIDFPLTERGGPQGFRSFVEAAADLTAAHGGSLSGEHGDGRARSELLTRMYSPEVIDLFGAVKHLFDPGNLLNPGVLVDPRPVDADLRLAARLREPRRTLRLAHDRGSVVDAVHRCTGVGKCVADNTGTGGVMCPSYLATRDEKDSTRGRSRVLQEMINGSLVTDGWKSDEVHEALDLCLSCKGCSSDCPTGIDMATYKAEALHQRYRRRIRPRSHYALGQLPRWARLAQPVAPLANRVMRIGAVQRIAKAAAGIDQRRSVPAFATEPLRRWARRTSYAASPGPDHDVVLWADSFTDGFASASGRAAVEVLEAAGLRVGVVTEPACCGLTWVSTGQLDRGATDHRAHRRRAAPVRRGRDPGRRARAVLPGDAALGRRRADRRPAGRRGRRRGALARRGAGHAARLGAPGPDRHDGRGAAALPPRQRDRLGRGRRPAGPDRRDRHPRRRLLRAGRQLRRRAGPLRGLGRGGRARPAPGGAGRGGGGGGARRRLLLPHPARRPRRRPGAAPRRAAGGPRQRGPRWGRRWCPRLDWRPQARSPRTHPYRIRGLLVLTAFRRAGNLFLRVWDTQALRVLVTVIVTGPRSCTRSELHESSSAQLYRGGPHRATRPTAG